MSREWRKFLRFAIPIWHPIPSFHANQCLASASSARESDYIQSRLFRNSRALSERKTGIVYYDCTNFYFEIGQAEADKQYGVSKENRPLPIVEMGLFMDMEGIPIAFGIFPGNEGEQNTMIPLVDPGAVQGHQGREERRRRHRAAAGRLLFHKVPGLTFAPGPFSPKILSKTGVLARLNCQTPEKG